MDEQAPRVALVTGGTGGPGKAVAAALVERGWSVFLQHMAADVLGPTIDSIQAQADQAGLGGEVAAGQADLDIPAEREQLIEQALEVFGAINLLVNAASGGQLPSADLLEVDEDIFRDAIDRVVVSPFFLTQLVAREMVRLVEAGQIENPRIVTINSISAHATSVEHGPQCMSRSALAMMTRLFADRLGAHGISVYEVRAGIISAGFGPKGQDDPAHRRYERLIRDGMTPIRRWGRLEDIARAVCAVAEGLLAFSTGEVINVDGGFHLRRL